MRAAFTLIELAISIIVAGLLFLQATQFNETIQYREDRELAMSQIEEIIGKYIYNSVSGYASNKGGYCSNDYSVRDISAYRIQKCVGLEGFNVEFSGAGDTDERDGSLSYFTFIEEYSESGKDILRMYVAAEDDYEIKVLFVSQTDDKQLFEKHLASMSNGVLKSKFVKSFSNAESLADVTYAGDEDDGFIRVHFKD